MDHPIPSYRLSPASNANCELTSGDVGFAGVAWSRKVAPVLGRVVDGVVVALQLFFRERPDTCVVGLPDNAQPQNKKPDTNASCQQQNQTISRQKHVTKSPK